MVCWGWGGGSRRRLRRSTRGFSPNGGEVPFLGNQSACWGVGEAALDGSAEHRVLELVLPLL